MANVVQPSFREYMVELAIAGGTPVSGTLKAVLLDLASYSYDSAHDFYSDISAHAVGTPTEITNLTFTGGLLDGDNLVLASVTGDESEAVAIILDTGVEATSPFVAYFDTGVTGIPVTPDGSDIEVNFNASGIIQF